MSGTEAPDALRAVRVSDAGIHLRGGEDRVLDVVFDGRRIGSFWLERDTTSSGAGRLYAWPAALTPYLDGSTTLALVDHVTDTELFSEEVTLGSGSGRIRVEDGQGNPLGLDKSERLMKLFGSRSAEHLEPLLDSMRAVVDALEQCGVRPFIAYGTLLGAVRGGHFIGHDSDADLGYVSAHDHPADAVLESFRLQRALVGMGYPITRYSGIAFKIFVEESDGARRGLDVFGGFLRAGRLYLMGEVGHDFRDEWLHPRSEVLLEGRPFPAPARPEHLLEAMYGPSWQVPDPAYKFETPLSTVRRLNGWFRGTRVAREEVWDKFYGPQGGRKDPESPSGFVRWVRKREPDMATAVDVGCGAGRDAAWLSRHGVNAWGLDYSGRAFRRQARRAQRRGLGVRYQWANLTELRSVLATGAQLAREPGPRVVLARHVADTTNDTGRQHLLRLARMIAGPSGRLYLQVQTLPSRTRRMPGVTRLGHDGLAALEAQIQALGGTVVAHDRITEAEDGDSPESAASAATISRLVVQWNR